VTKKIQREKRDTHSGEVASMYRLKMMVGLIVLLVVCWSGFVFGQDAQVMDQNALSKFRIAKTQFYKGEKLFNKGDWNKAEKMLMECLENFPGYSYAHFYLSRIAYELKNFTKALEYIESAKKTHIIFSKLSASTYQEYLDQLREQKSSLEQQIIDMKQKLSTIGSGGINKARSDLENGISASEASIAQINNRLNSPIAQLAEIPADYFYIHGNILFKMNKFQESYDQYMLAVKSDPKHSNALGNLANLCFMSTQYQKALDYLDKAESFGFKANPKFRAAINDALKQ